MVDGPWEAYGVQTPGKSNLFRFLFTLLDETNPSFMSFEVSRFLLLQIGPGRFPSLFDSHLLDIFFSDVDGGRAVGSLRSADSK